MVIIRIKYIFITYHHDDHVGFLGDLLQRCDAEVIVNPLALELVKQGKNQEPAGSGYSSLPASLFGKVKKGVSLWIEDPVKFGQSWDKMLALEPNIIYPSHGTPFSPKALGKYRH